MELRIHTKQKDYPIYFERGILSKLKEYLKDTSIGLIVSDDGVPEKWLSIVQTQYPNVPIYRFKQGEASKNMNVYQDLLKVMLENHLSRKDTVLALGGGVVGDLVGFACATYMRGISYINVPTTTLSQIDSSIGGKTAIDFMGVKNSVGAFYQPTAAFIDPDTLSTLPKRHFINGLAEAIKEGMTFEEELFAYFEKDYESHIDEIIYRCLEIKKEIVEEDERENGRRKLLNFEHTIGHAYESYYELGQYLHGECVAMGMVSILENKELKARLCRVLEKVGLPTSCDANPKEVLRLIQNDKKTDHNQITIIQVDEIGKGYLDTWSMKDMERKLGL